MTHRIAELRPRSFSSIQNRAAVWTRVWAGLIDTLLSVLALLGLVCIAATIAAFAFNISFIMFKTGSMAPAIPAGSLALVREVPASTVRTGDITTLSRGANELPITHRVLSATLVAENTYDIVMKGDANPGPDPTPYRADTVRKVIWAAPELGYYVARFGAPKYIALTTLAVAFLVVWTFWPKKEQ